MRHDDLLGKMADGRAGDAGHADALGFALQAGGDAGLLLGVGVIELPENQAADLRKNSRPGASG